MKKSVTAGTIGKTRKQEFGEAGKRTVCCRLMSWTGWNRETPKMEKANMDDSERQSLVTEGRGLPNDLTIN